MCSQGKCCCLKLETGTLVFGIMASAVNGLLLLFIVGGIIALNIVAIQYIRPDGNEVRKGSSVVDYEFHYEILLYINLTLVGALLKSTLGFVFTVLLCIGVTKRNLEYIKAYYIYGIVMTVLGFAITVGIVIFVIVGKLIIAMVSMVILIPYLLTLHMVKLTHQKLSEEVYGSEHKRSADSVKI